MSASCYNKSFSSLIEAEKEALGSEEMHKLCRIVNWKFKGQGGGINLGLFKEEIFFSLVLKSRFVLGFVPRISTKQELKKKVETSESTN